MVNFFRCKLIGNIFNRKHGSSFAGNVYDKKYLAPTLNTSRGGYRQPIIVVYEKDYEKRK